MRSHLDWPFFEDRHRALAVDATRWAHSHLADAEAARHIDRECRRLAAAYGEAGFLHHVVAREKRIDVRAACICRETFAQHSGLAEFVFAMQGLGSGPISLFGSDALREEYLPRVASGQSVAAFAASEREAGSDLSAIATTARHDGGYYVIDGEKTWISNAGIADFYVVFARTGEKLSAFVVDAGTPGVTVSARVDVSAPHPLGTLKFDECRVPLSKRIGEDGRGMAVALGTLDVFRPTVGAAALGFARRALAEATGHARSRRAFGAPLSDLQLVRAKLADMATAIDASALLVYRAAWAADTQPGRVTREAAMAKAFATETAQGVIDDAIQIAGARGVVANSPLERLYREIRPLRIYEGATDIQRLVIARSLLEDNE
ncbi:MAG TPA: acyl-CoA dehydrogenase family protein [Candidatus Krumholzibacteria bacterium]|nr:acyl-CoA dehydrogenase family protein [Candidatus Krumholzibacteria bacterium]